MNIKQRRLPQAYQEVEWIESDGNCGIEFLLPSIVRSLTWEFKTKVQTMTTSSSEMCFFGARNGTLDGESWASNIEPYVIYNQIGYWTSSPSAQVRYVSDDRNPFTYSLRCNGTDKYICTINGTEYSNAVTPASKSFGHLRFFHYGDAGSYKYTGRSWGGKLIVGGQTVCNAVPCYRISDNVIGMYDVVNNVFQTDKFGGTFTKGADVVTVDSIAIPQGDVIKIQDSSNNVLWQKRYGGIAVGWDSKKLNNSIATIENSFIDEEVNFVTEWLDTGSAGSHSITLGYVSEATGSMGTIKGFEDKSGICSDWYSVWTTVRTITLPGRYIVCSIRKANAPYFYIYDNTNSRYLVKGDMVS